MNKRTVTHCTTETARSSESGVALLTVLALLSIFAVVLVGFTFTIRMEENTIRQYADSVTVQESTEAAIQGVLAQLARDLDPSKPHYVLGRPQPKYTSLLDPWALGYAGTIPPNVSYDARSHMLDIRPSTVFDRKGLRVIPTPIPLGVDEDPPGDVTGKRGVLRQSTGDGAPGLKGVDDDLDGEIDGSDPNDDDEDYRDDEDGLDRRRDGRFFTPGTGYDQDGDQRGVFDESAKISLNFAGNTLGTGRRQAYNLGVSPSELDLPLFIYNRAVSGFNANQAEALARAIVNFRYGSTADGGGTDRKPGLDNKDDNNNNNPRIVEVQEYSDAFSDLSRFEGEPLVIMGNQVDDDGDGLFDEEDEHYIGPTTENTSGTALTRPFDHNNPEMFRPGDKIDNDGDGFIDEDKEGVDDPDEFDIFKPKGDDHPFTTVDDLKLVGALRNEIKTNPLKLTVFEMLRDAVTIFNQSDEISGPLSAKNNEVAKINPNLVSNWLSQDIWNMARPITNRADFQYSPKPRLEDFLAIQVDQDGDWQAEAESNLKDEKDNDGDGLVDEPSDDWDGNLYPSGDFDGFAEPDVGAPAYTTGGSNFDRDFGQTDKIRVGDKFFQNMRILGYDDSLNADNFSRDKNLVDLDENRTDLILGMNVEGDGMDSDGDLLIDDLGDFNGDEYLSYDPEWHVSEDAWGDQSGDGYPGLGADPEADNDTREGRIVKDPDVKDPLIMTSLADDDFDGYADFYDPQVLAAMYAPEWDGVDNDNDGEVDEIGERYIAAYDDDEDGRMDEDPPEFQVALNLIDFIDSWQPYPVTEDPDVRQLLGKSQQESVLADPVTTRNLRIYSSRQRAFRMHPRLLSGPNQSAKDAQEFSEQMRLLLPNPPLQGMPVNFEGVEAIRINEVFAKPMIRLEAEETLESIQYNPSDPNDLDNPANTVITFSPSRFKVEEGAGDDGALAPTTVYDSNWGPAAPHADGDPNQVTLPGYTYLRDGFRNTYNPFLPLVNMDSLAPAFVFSVTNVAEPADTQTTQVGRQTDEIATWVFENIPAGIYDVAFYLHPNDSYRPEVKYEFNRQEITFLSDVEKNSNLPGATPADLEILRRDTGTLTIAGSQQPNLLSYRLTPFPLADKTRVSANQRVVVRTDGKLEVKITAQEPAAGKGSGEWYTTSFDRIELIAPWYQYVELVNLSTEDIDLSGYQINTPYGHYIIPKNTIIGRMKPSFQGDDGRDLQPNIGIPGNGVPFEPLFDDTKRDDPGGTVTSTDLLLEDNKLLLANNKTALIGFIKDNYPDVPNLDNRVVQLELAPREFAMVQRSLPSRLSPTGSGELGNALREDFFFKVVDVQEDILSDNAKDKFVTLYDPSGNYLDSFKYRTTFNNAVVDIPGNTKPGGANSFDIVALPGYRGMESFERADPTHFDTVQRADSNGDVFGERSVPSSIRLDVKDAVLVNLDPTRNFARTQIGGYVNPSQGIESDKENPRLKLQRFADRQSALLPLPLNDAKWNGWDFIGDHYEYPHDISNSPQVTLLEQTQSIAREAVAPGGPENVVFYQKLGGFENAQDVPTPQSVRYTGFIWRLGVRELIRAGYDPDVDDQLTVRVLGRKAVMPDGTVTDIDLPVGEVLVNPAAFSVDPGANLLDEQPKRFTNNPLNNHFQFGQHIPVFSKLRNGDTAFTLDLRERFRDLSNDLRSTSLDEPIIEIMVVIRKSTRDHNILNRETNQLTLLNRPDLARLPLPLRPDPDGYVRVNLGGVGAPIGNLGDDNYFFKGIELFGRGRKGQDDGAESNSKRVLLAGTPGRDNTGYVPAYPRRRFDLSGKQRDSLDIIDNTAYVKNGPLATVGEISRLFTGNKFETINTPLIPQRLEDKAAVLRNRVLSNAELSKLAVGNTPDFRKMLAQRERLDQWENQYTQIYNMITTAKTGIRSGAININTAPREVLVALPFCPPEQPGRLKQLQVRNTFNTICADFILEGRQPGGHDGHFGIHNLDDDEFLTRANLTLNRTLADTLSDFKLRSTGREFDAFKEYKDIENERLDRLNIAIQNIEKDKPGNLRSSVFLSTEVTDPDDGPYTDIGSLLVQLTHLRRRDRFAELMRIPYDRTFDLKRNAPGDLRERLNDLTNEELTTEDMETIMNRISNLITVRSRAFSIITRGRIFDSDGNITAQRKLETVYQR